MSQKPPVIPSAQKVGVDVPWVSSWSQESQGGVGPCPTVDGAMASGERAAAQFFRIR